MRDVSDRSVSRDRRDAESDIAAAVARRLAEDGWNVTTGWRPFDATEPWGSVADEAEQIVEGLQTVGVRAAFRE